MSFHVPRGYDGPALDSLIDELTTGVDESRATAAHRTDERASDQDTARGSPERDDARHLSVVTPMTGDEIGTVPAATPAAMRGAVERAQAAQSAWADRPLSERVVAVESFAALVRRHRADLLDLVQLESGKTRMDAFEECLDVELTAGYYADHAPAFLAPERHPGIVPWLTRVTEHREPYGVAGVIAPWNYPLTLAISDAIPALLAGNAVVCKPAEQTPFTAAFVARLAAAAGIPEACFQVVPGEGEALGGPLVEAADVVCFTGSTEVGREVGARAGRELIPVTLELGGSGPMLVREDAPLGRATAGAARGGFASAGQLCIATERIYVHEARHEAFLDRLVERVRGLELGTAFDYGPDVGSLVSRAQLELVESHVDEAVDAGATLLTGGRRRDDVGPFVYEPTVLTDVPEDAAVATEETFGPILTVTPVADDDAAVERANDSPYGLHGSVWTGDPAAGRRLARRLECGSVAVNDAYISSWGSSGAPMGGRKDSGIGRRHGRAGIERFTDSQSVAVQRGRPLTPPAGVPDRLTARALSGYLRLVRWLGIR